MDAPDSTTVKIASLKAPPDPLGMDELLDRTFTTKNIVSSLADIWRWFQLGIFLEFKRPQLERIKQDRQTTEDRITKIVNKWRRSDPLASWKKLVDVLKAMGEHHVAFNIFTNYPEMKKRHEVEEKEKQRRYNDLQKRLDELEQQRLNEDVEWGRTSQEWRCKLENVQRSQCKGDPINVVVGWYKMLDGQTRRIETRHQKWKEATEEIETFQDHFKQDEHELSTRLKALSQLGEEHVGLQEVKLSLRKCRKILQYLQDKLESYKKYLRSEKQLGDPLGLDDPFDCTLLTRNIISYLRSFWRWFRLGLNLKFEDGELKRIEQDNTSTENCIIEMLGRWVKSDPLATWRKLINALIEMKEHRVALRMVIDYPEMKKKHEEEEQEKQRKLKDVLHRLVELEKERADDDAEWERIEDWRSKLEAVRRDHAEFQDNKESKRERLRRKFASKEYKERAELFANSRVERENLQHIGERIDALVEWDRMLKDHQRKIKARQQKWKETAQELEALQDRFQQDEGELSTRLGALSKLGAGYERFEEVKKSMENCSERVRRCQEKLQNYKEYLRSSDAIMSQCHIQLESTKGELENLKYEYERCVRKVQNFQKELSKQKVSLFRALAAAGVSHGSFLGGIGAGAAMGSLFGPIGSMVGGLVGAVSGAMVGVHGMNAILKSELEVCEEELKESIETVKKGERILEMMRNEDDQ